MIAMRSIAPRRGNCPRRMVCLLDGPPKTLRAAAGAPIITVRAPAAKGPRGTRAMPPAQPSPAPPADAPPPDEAKVPETFDGLSLDVAEDAEVDKKLAQIELAGEEVASGWKP